MNAGAKYAENTSSRSAICESMRPVIEIVEVAIMRPTSIDPASPMKSRAGCQLSGRKPRQAPTRTTVVRLARLKYSVCAWLCSRYAYTKNTPPAMIATPATSPSRPSMKFTAFITRTTATIVATSEIHGLTIVCPPIGSV